MDNQQESHSNEENKIRTLTLVQSIRSFILGELRALIYDHEGSHFIKFVNIAIAIEYLGACLDEFPFNEEGKSETRFNDALKKLFNNKYKKFTKKDSDAYLFEEFRCCFVHQLRPGKSVVVTHRKESKKEGTKHLIPIKDTKQHVLILEDFYDDLEKAAESLIWKFENGKLSNKKADNGFIMLIPVKANRSS